MASWTELRRILEEWKTRFSRIQAILQPPQWDEPQWRQFSQALALLVRQYGASWVIDPSVYWDLRWQLQGGGDLICQLEHVPSERTTLIVAQTGGFAAQLESGSYTWLWAEFDPHGRFARDPYWVDGTWKDALASLLMPLQHHFGQYLMGPAATPTALLLQPGARPNPDAPSNRGGAPLGLGWSHAAVWETTFGPQASDSHHATPQEELPANSEGALDPNAHAHDPSSEEPAAWAAWR